MYKSFLKLLTNKIKLRLVTYLVWDFDGTLYRNNHLARELKLEYIKYINSHSNKSINEDYFNKIAKKKIRWSAAVSSILHIDELTIINEVEATFNKTRYLVKNKKLVNTIQELPYKHLIITNSSKNEVEPGLKKIGFISKNGYPFYPFEKIFTREDFHLLKPHKTAFQCITNFTTLHEIRHLIIGDSYSEDINPAQSYGFQAIHIDYLTEYFPCFNNIF